VSRRGLLLLATLTLLAGPVLAQSGFSVAHTVARTTPTHAEISGTVTNETRADALDVSVTVEALDANGKRLARGISFVSRRVPAGATASFAAKVPAVAGVNGYRAAVTSFRFVHTIEGP
jgi:hypothetical protein